MIYFKVNEWCLILSSNIYFIYRQYREYLENLLAYLIYFFQRTEPLQDLDRIFSKVALRYFSLLILTFNFQLCFMLPYFLELYLNRLGRYGFFLHVATLII